MVVNVFVWTENIFGKGENAEHQHFLLFHTMFSNVFIFMVLINNLIIWLRVKPDSYLLYNAKWLANQQGKKVIQRYLLFRFGESLP